jgi:hypothetical protein
MDVMDVLRVTKILGTLFKKTFFFFFYFSNNYFWEGEDPGPIVQNGNSNFRKLVSKIKVEINLKY